MSKASGRFSVASSSRRMRRSREKKKKKKKHRFLPLYSREELQFQISTEENSRKEKTNKMFARLFLLLALFAAAASARRAPAPSAAPAASFWNIDETAANAEVLAEAAMGAPEPRPLKATPSSTAAAPAPSKLQSRRKSTAEDELAADAELDAVAVASNAFAQIAAGAQEIEAMMDESAFGEQLPTFVEIHDDADTTPGAAVPAEIAVAPHGLVAVGDDAIFAAANSAASEASSAAPMLPPPSEEFHADLEAALEAAAMSGTPLVVVDEASPEVVPVAGEKREAGERE